MTYIRKSVIKVEGGQRKARTSDDNAQELLMDILKEMKIMNFHMSQVTDNNVTDEDLDIEEE